MQKAAENHAIFGGFRRFSKTRDLLRYQDRVTDLDVIFRCPSGQDFEDVFGWDIRRKDGRIRVWRDVRLDINDAVIGIDPDDVNRFAHVLHPEAMFVSILENKEHAVAAVQEMCAGKSLLALARRVGDRGDQVLAVYIQNGTLSQRVGEAVKLGALFSSYQDEENERSYDDEERQDGAIEDFLVGGVDMHSRNE